MVNNILGRLGVERIYTAEHAAAAPLVGIFCRAWVAEEGDRRVLREIPDRMSQCELSAVWIQAFVDLGA
jgi:hypothetical protein